MKRFYDLLFCIFLLILLSPIIVFISLIIKLTSHGPVLFKQKRIGQYKKEFYIYKFRTMYIETPKDVPTHLLDNPDRFITPIGKFLRKSSLDELPQLLNILKGEMSFIGPRPALYNQTDLNDLREKYGVQKAKPGITGWAQVNGRDELDIATKAEYDREYIERLSIWFDLQILFKTFMDVAKGKGVVEGRQVSGNKQVDIY